MTTTATITLATLGTTDAPAVIPVDVLRLILSAATVGLEGLLDNADATAEERALAGAAWDAVESLHANAPTA